MCIEHEILFPVHDLYMVGLMSFLFVHVYISVCQVEIPYEIPYALVNALFLYVRNSI
jgi:hypothetical protein